LNLRGLKLDYKDIFEHALEIYSQKIFICRYFNYCFMLKNGINEIYSFDEDFDSLEGIKRTDMPPFFGTR